MSKKSAQDQQLGQFNLFQLQPQAAKQEDNTEEFNGSSILPLHKTAAEDTVAEEQYTMEQVTREAPSPAVTEAEQFQVQQEEAAPADPGFEKPYTVRSKAGTAHVRHALELETNHKVKTVNWKREIISWVATVLIAVILALVIRSFVFFVGNVQGPSMQPTLYSGYKLMVTRYDYSIGKLRRGDVVIINYDLDSGEKTCVKRIAALPGETIRIQDGMIYITGTDGNEFLYQENYTHVSFYEGYSMEPVFVPDDCVFVIGDNHINSADSRMIGPIKISNILGHVRCIIYPFRSVGTVDAK